MTEQLSAETIKYFYQQLSNAQIESAFIASLLVVIVPIGVLAVLRFGFKKIYPTKRWMLLVSFSFIIAIFCLKLLTTDVGLTLWEQIVDAALKTIMAFGGDEDQMQYFNVIKKATENCFSDTWRTFWNGYAAGLLVAAPIAGCAFIVDMFTAFFPKLGVRMRFYKEHYYFSELNERSIILAESIFENSGKGIFSSPLLVFTDAYFDDESEKSSELHARAKRIGAFCIKDDPLHFKAITFRKRSYFLMDVQESANLQALARFSVIKKAKTLKRADIYVFYQDESYSLTETNVWKNIEENAKNEFGKKRLRLYKRRERKVVRTAERLLKSQKQEPDYNEKLLYAKAAICNVYNPERHDCNMSEEAKRKMHSDLKAGIEQKLYKDVNEKILPLIRRVRYGQNLIFNLLERTPLFTPLLGRERAPGEVKDFNLTILGFGELSSRMLLAATWCGQMLGYRLNINVAYNGNVDDLKKSLDSISPEILSSTEEGNKLLKIYADESNTEFSPVYFNLRHAQVTFPDCPIKDITFTPINGGGTHNILDSDYIFISLGSDKLNITVAEQVKRVIAAKQINEHAVAAKASERYTPKQVIIAVSVFDPYLNSLFDQDQYGTSVTERAEVDAAAAADSGKTPPKSDIAPDGNEYGKSDVKIIAFGSLKFSHSMQNIMMENMSYNIDRFQKTYNTNARNAGARKRIEHNYDYWSTAAKAVHVKYKVFSAYQHSIDKNTVDSDWGKNCKTLTITDAFAKYDALIDDKAKDKTLADKLAWLEHRRWVAYTRSTGFTKRELSIGEKQINKNVPLRIHVSLVESKGGSSKTDCLAAVENAVGRTMRENDMPNKLIPPVYQKRRLRLRERLVALSWRMVSDAKIPLSDALSLAGIDSKAGYCIPEKKRFFVERLNEKGAFVEVEDLSYIIKKDKKESSSEDKTD